MSQKNKYDNAHKKQMDDIDEDMSISDIPEKFVKGVFGFPKTLIDEFTKSDIEEKAERDALDGKYDPPEEKSGCFISTACAVALDLPDDCQELTVLRTFRDNYLLKREEGRRAVTRYYEIAPAIVARIDSLPSRSMIYRKIFSQLVRPSAKLIEAGLQAQAFSLYQDSILELTEMLGNKTTNKAH